MFAPKADKNAIQLLSQRIFSINRENGFGTFYCRSQKSPKL